MTMIMNKRVSTEIANEYSIGFSETNHAMKVEEARSTPSVRWYQISTSNSSMMASTTRIQTISGGEDDSAAWPPDLRFDIKNPPPVSRGGLTITRDPFRCRSGRIPLREPPCPGLAGWRGRQPHS